MGSSRGVRKFGVFFFLSIESFEFGFFCLEVFVWVKYGGRIRFADFVVGREGILVLFFL